MEDCQNYPRYSILGRKARNNPSTKDTIIIPNSITKCSMQRTLFFFNNWILINNRLELTQKEPRFRNKIKVTTRNTLSKKIKTFFYRCLDLYNDHDILMRFENTKQRKIK